jgi:uncharacterized membrane protein YfcA
MTFVNILIPFLAAILGGTLNSVAGGGSFITFPALIYANVLPKLANATSTAALWPGSVASSWAFRKELVKQNKLLVLILVITSLIGGVGGAILLLATPQETFVRLIPFLLLAATLLFAFSPLVNRQLKQFAINRKKAGTDSNLSWAVLSRVAVLQLIIAIYGGYFGGGIGILMLASLGLLGMENIHEMNAIKNVLASCINGVAVVTFIIAGAVVWPNALTMVVGAIIGGFGGAYYARKLDPKFIRGFVILVGCVITLYFLFKYNFL